MNRTTVIKCLVIVVLASLTWLNRYFALNVPSEELGLISGSIASFIVADLIFNRKSKKTDA